jgi:hypothetical protein
MQLKYDNGCNDNDAADDLSGFHEFI